MTPPAPTEALRLLISDHLPAYLRLPSDFLIWTAAGERVGLEWPLYTGREMCQTEVQVETHIETHIETQV